MSNVFQSKRALRIYGVSAMCVALVCVVLRIVGLLFFFDRDIGYYKSGSVVPLICTVVLTLAVIVPFALCFIKKIKVCCVQPQNTHSVRSFAIFPTVVFAAYSVIYALNVIDYAKLYGQLPLTYILTLLCSVLACVFFGMIRFSKEKNSVLYVVCGLLAIVWMIIALAECYFDTFVQMNSPNKIIFQFAVLSAMLLIVNELRMGTDSRRHAFHLFSATVATVFLFTSAVPSIVCYYAGKMPPNYTLLYSDTVLLLLAVFALVRLIQLCFGKDEPMEAAEKLAEELTEESANAEEATEATETNEKSVSDTDTSSNESEGA